MLFGGDPPLQEGEHRIIQVRSHPWSLIRAALPLPALALLPIPYAVLDWLFPDLRLSAQFPAVAWVLAVLFCLYLVKWILFDVLPWTQRVFVLTSRRVIVQWGVLAVHRRECSLRKVQESDYKSRGLVSRLLDVGDVDVQTAGASGTITIRAVAHPGHLQGQISASARAVREEEMRRRVAETPHEIVRQLETAVFGAPRPSSEATESLRPVSTRAVRAQQRLSLLPDEAVVEVVRQHPALLIVGVLSPLIGVLFLVAVVAVVGLWLMPYAVAVVVLALAPWAVWRVLGYLSHQWVLTTERLMELRSLPLFFEMRDVVQLASVQDVGLEIPTLLGRLADVGDVVVEVTGPAERVVLKTVSGPAHLQKLIFETIDARQRRQREKEDQRLVSTLGHWFEQYHKLQREGDDGR